jgi:hypothetical protein
VSPLPTELLYCGFLWESCGEFLAMIPCDILGNMGWYDIMVFLMGIDRI